MKVLNSRLDLAAFLKRIPMARERVLMLDYDGTLAPFKVRPEKATPYPGVAKLLNELMRDNDTRVIIVSGRRAADVIPLLPLSKPPEIWGSHGWERLLSSGELILMAPEKDVNRDLQKASDLADEFIRNGGRIERKPASIALHWRGLPALTAAQIRRRAHVVWSPFIRNGSLELLSFDGGIELRAQGCNKRHAVNVVLSETPDNSVAAYLGDDMTDEDAFQAVKTRGIAVLVRPNYRDTQADIWIKPPRELLAFIKFWRVKEKPR
ncbi:MAG: trehalose-phosphatase [Candidatus Binatia bacterium]